MPKPMNILYVTAHAPYPTHTGSGQRSCLLFNALAKLGEVRTVTLESEKAFTDQELQTLRSLYNLVATGPVTPAGTAGIWRLLHAINPKISTSIAHNLDGSKSRFRPDPELIKSTGIRDLVESSDIIVGRYTHTLTRLDLLNTGKPTYLDVDDLTSDLYKSRLAVTKNILNTLVLKRHYKNIKFQESSIFKQLTGIWIANPDNQSSLGLQRANVLPNIPFIHDKDSLNQQPILENELVIGSIAAYKHLPNVEGVHWFLVHVWPLIRHRIHNARFAVYGSNLSPEVASKWADIPGVEIVGFVQNIRTAYAASTITICPVLRGAGTNIKVLESGAHGRNCIITPAAARGYTANRELKKRLWIAKDAKSMADIAVNLLSDHSLNQRTSESFRATVRRHYSVQLFNNIVQSTIH